MKFFARERHCVTSTSVGRNVRHDDFGAGVRVGKNARLDRGIGSADGPRLLAQPASAAGA
jgi:hypothetical protein